MTNTTCNLSYVVITPYTILKSRTGGVIARLLSRLELELIGAQMLHPDEELVKSMQTSHIKVWHQKMSKLLSY